MTTAQDNLELLKEVGTKGYASSCALTELTLRTWGGLAEKQMAAFSIFVEAGTKQVELAKDISDTKTLFADQAELNEELGENLKANGQEVLELASNAQEEYRDWLQNGLSIINDELNHAVGYSIK